MIHCYLRCTAVSKSIIDNLRDVTSTSIELNITSNCTCIISYYSEKLQIPKTKTELFKKTFTYSGPKLCNELPFSIWQASSHNVFKTKVKSLILNDDVP